MTEPSTPPTLATALAYHQAWTSRSAFAGARFTLIY